MSEENVDLVRQVIAAYSVAGEIRDDLIDPAIEVWESPDLPGGLAGKGHCRSPLETLPSASSRVRRLAPGAS
jgi:hypothetical protein